MVSEARRVAAQTFRSWGMDPGQTELACLLVSEVVTNAVLHASVTPSPGRELDFDMGPLMMPAPVGVPGGRRPAVPAQRPRPRLARRAPVRRRRRAGLALMTAHPMPPRRRPRSPESPVAQPSPQGVRAAAAARRDLGVGGSIRPRPQAPPDPHGGGDRRRRPRPLPGRAAGYPVGIQADPGGQGGLVRDAAQRRPALAVAGRALSGRSVPRPCEDHIKSTTMTTMTIGPSQFLPDTLSFILPRKRVQPKATMAPMSTSKMSPVHGRLLSLRFCEPVSRLRHSVPRRETRYREVASERRQRVSRSRRAR